MTYIRLFIIGAIMMFVVSVYLTGKSNGRREVLEDIMSERLESIEDKAEIDRSVRGMSNEELFDSATRFVVP